MMVRDNDIPQMRNEDYGILGRMKKALDHRKQEGSYRRLVTLPEDGVDFSSNDYLSLSRCQEQQKFVEKAQSRVELGATGSRLLSGHSKQYEEIESFLSGVHNSNDALVCSSGYMANLCVISCLPFDVVIVDELVHNSIRMATQIPFSKKSRRVLSFSHNDTHNLQQKLESVRASSVIIIVESVYSMDGDISPLHEILHLAKLYQAHVIVDEAHGFGVYGRTNPHHLDLPAENSYQSSVSDDNHHGSVGGGMGVLSALQLERHEALLAAVYTYGKAAGCHGAVIVSNAPVFKPYLVNYARPFIYSTALPPHALSTIRCAYITLFGQEGNRRRDHLFRLVQYFRQHFSSSAIHLYPSPSPIQAVSCPGNQQCLTIAKIISKSFHVYPIRHPTVPKGEERIRIIFHSHNTLSQVQQLIETIHHAYRHASKQKTSLHNNIMSVSTIQSKL